MAKTFSEPLKKGRIGDRDPSIAPAGAGRIQSECSDREPLTASRRSASEVDTEVAERVSGNDSDAC